jgi:hypothetical protein
MKLTIQILLAIALAPFAFAQSSSSSPAASGAATGRTDIYHVHFANAATGKAKDLGEEMKKPALDAAAPDHLIVLRHEDGDSWDYCVITHLGAKATIEASRPAPASNLMALYAAHTDTFVSGPSWTEFAKQLGLDDAAKSKTSAFVVSIYRPAAGQREALDKFLSEPPDRATDSYVGRVTLQHMEGAAWTFLTVQRWNSWADYGKDNTASIAQLAKNPQAGWFKLRDLASFHTDTLCDRLAP